VLDIGMDAFGIPMASQRFVINRSSNMGMNPYYIFQSESGNCSNQ
jgi:hypothetical protein